MKPMKYPEQLHTRDGRLFPFSSLAEYLLHEEEVRMPVEAMDLDSKPRRAVCIDDGITTDRMDQRLVPFSGVGVGEAPKIAAQVLAGVEEISPHRSCGKAALTLTARRRQLGKESPTAGEIDDFARIGAEYLGTILDIEVGRMIDFDDHRTHLDRPEDHHLAQGAVIGLSGRFPHNLLPSEQVIPAQYRLAGTFLTPDDEQLIEEAANEALLALKIASGEHGAGIVDNGFQYTALVDLMDQQGHHRTEGLLKAWDVLKEKRVAELGNTPLNEIKLDVVGYRVEPSGTGCAVSFEPVKLKVA